MASRAAQPFSLVGQMLSGLQSHEVDTVSAPADARALPGHADTGPFPRTSHLYQSLDRELRGLEERLAQRLSGLDIDADVPFELKFDGHNGLVVDGNHPQRAEIEDLVRDDPALITAFHRVAAAAVACRRAALDPEQADEIHVVVHRGHATASAEA
jgi:hypothetical protein